MPLVSAPTLLVPHQPDLGTDMLLALAALLPFILFVDLGRRTCHRQRLVQMPELREHRHSAHDHQHSQPWEQDGGVGADGMGQDAVEYGASGGAAHGSQGEDREDPRHLVRRGVVLNPASISRPDTPATLPVTTSGSMASTAATRLRMR